MSCQGLASQFCRVLPPCDKKLRGAEGIITVTADEIKRAAEVHIILLLAQTNSDYWLCSFNICLGPRLWYLSAHCGVLSPTTPVAHVGLPSYFPLDLAILPSAQVSLCS